MYGHLLILLFGANLLQDSDEVPAPVAAFSATPLSGAAPLEVTFTDASTNTPTSWSWDFGNTNGSILQNPVYTYPSSGTYTVTLSASNATGTDVETKTAYITVNVPPPPAASTETNPWFYFLRRRR